MSESEAPRRMRTPKPPATVTVFAQFIMCVLPVDQLLVGAVYHGHCPRQPYIPTYLLVMGVVSFLLNVIYILPCGARISNKSKAWSGLVLLFLFCWFIAGNVWIYSIYEPNYNKTASSMDTYCNKTLYLHAFWTTNLFYILLAFIIVSSCCTHFLCDDDD